MNTYEKVQAVNEHYENQGYCDDTIYSFDEDTINELFSNPWDALRAAHFGDINFTDDYFQFNGYGNIETLSDWKIDEMYNEIETEDDED